MTGQVFKKRGDSDKVCQKRKEKGGEGISQSYLEAAS
jgi:hypothetical protein